MSRIIAGTAGGTSLTSVPGTGTRPTTDRVKEALFSRLESYDILSGARVLDLFAGSGALGIESASRGAVSVDLVELADKAAGTCKQNAKLINDAAGRTVVSVHRAKADTYLRPTTWTRKTSPPCSGRCPGTWPRAPSSCWSAPPAHRNPCGPRGWNASVNASTARPRCGLPSRPSQRTTTPLRQGPSLSPRSARSDS
jgi:hypothetical protein